MREDGPVSAIKTNTCNYLTRGRLRIRQGIFGFIDNRIVIQVGLNWLSFMQVFSPAFFNRNKGLLKLDAFYSGCNSRNLLRTVERSSKSLSDNFIISLTMFLTRLEFLIVG